MTERAEQLTALYAEDRLADQLTFYRNRRTEAEQARDQAILVKSILLAASGAAGVVGAAVPELRTALAVVASFLAAAATALAAYQSLYAFPRLAKLYRDAEVSLAALRALGLSADLPPPEIRARVERIEAVFRHESSQWGQLTQRPAPSTGSQPTDQDGPD